VGWVVVGVGVVWGGGGVCGVVGLWGGGVGGWGGVWICVVVFVGVGGGFGGGGGGCMCVRAAGCEAMTWLFTMHKVNKNKSATT